MKQRILPFIGLSFLILMFIMVLLGCSKEDQDDPNQPLIDQMQAVADSIIDYTHVPGMVALVVDKKKGIDWVYEAGLSNTKQQLPMNRNYTFRIGSCTKTMVAIVLLQLVADGKISLDDKLSTYHPEYPKSDQITIAMVATMRSGIFDYTQDTEVLPNQLSSNPSKTWTPDELIHIAFSHDFYFEPGTSFSYSNTNYIILGKLIEEITGHSLETEIANRITEPLNLTQTGLLTSGTDLPGDHARGYYDGGYVPNLDYTEVFSNSLPWAAGSAYSTPRELQRYAESLVGGGLLSDSLQTSHLNDHFTVFDEKVAYGIGLIRLGTFYGHNGGIPGFTSSMYHSNDKDCTIIIYFNCALGGIHPDYLFNRFVTILYGNDY
ncbi:MAG: beta-lactamase family protein [Candidatus Delongbacteria bacterium]|nr:beta-lactamase family protein [Candidatus Delongbacteria bacterium]